MHIMATRLDAVKVLRPKRITEIRSGTPEAGLAQIGLNLALVQQYQSFTRQVGTVKGLHYQAPPQGQDKLVRVATGEIMDVAVDARVGAPTYGQWACVILSAPL